jgi:hypothetical protein
MSKEKIKVGDRVRITLDNGYTNTGTVKRLFKNGRFGIDEDGDSRLA